ncbi:hypothetical protein TRVL_00380 [Trypanosoma vivax]|uniref:CS domain-containing protein n=1 Tax=Trypanosoma vivax (strain Y486) TaxID=1055687 RepID=G0U3H9_TRYVY|nr:hypothetical protein TRVL_00380 [Trypanosoma vivax]CCC50836.1 conserved hypothetical protein [Trypanosoma vivax Y486]
MPGIDYSKWNKICDSDDSDEENRIGKPSVTRLEYPSRVTLAPDGVRVDVVPPQATVSPFKGERRPTVACGVPMHSAGCVASECKASSNSTGHSPSTFPCAQTAVGEAKCVNEDKDKDEDEDRMMYQNLTRNGGCEARSHLWSQTRDTASVSFIMPSMQTRAKDIYNFRIFTEEQSNHSSAYFIAFGVKGAAGEHRFQLRYSVKVDEEVVEGCWQLHTLATMSLRLLVVQLVKEPLGLGMFLWWDRCFVTDTTVVDTTKISGRSSSETKRAEGFRESWAKAHDEFRRWVTERQERRLSCDDSDEKIASEGEEDDDTFAADNTRQRG